MATIRHLYDPAITSKSRQELVQFAKWFNEKHGSWPSVIGGWAVWSYYQDGFGSRDVDLILPSDDWIETVLKKEYFPYRGFSPYQHLGDFLGQKHYGKLVDPDKPNGDIVFFDLLSASKPREDPQELGVFVDWNWVNDFRKEAEIDGIKIFVPEVELLLLLKIIGALARIRDLRYATDPSYLTSKIWKDYYDIANLLAYVTIDEQKLKNHITNTKLDKKLILEFFFGYVSRKDVLEETKANPSIMEKPFLNILGTKKILDM
ncbi:MAG: hypothetical protein ACREA3_06155 [Nitrosotalea sp.]